MVSERFTPFKLNSVRYAFFRVLPVRGCRPSFVRQTAIQIPQIPYRGPTN